MGKKAEKARNDQRAQVARAAKQTKKATGQTSKPAVAHNPSGSVSGDPPASTTGPAATTSKRTTRLTKVISQEETAVFPSLISTRNNPPRSRSTSTAVSSGSGVSTRRSSAQKAAAERILETRQPRRTAVAAKALLQQVIQMSSDDNSDASGGLQSDSLVEYDEDEDDSLGGESDGSSDIEDPEVEVAPSGQLKLVALKLVAPTQKAPKQKPAAAPVSRGTKKRAQVDSDDGSNGDDDDDDDDGPFDMTFEINDIAKGIRTNLTMSSTTFWQDLHRRIAQVLNIFPDSLHLQYRFSNEQKGSLPFNLDSAESYQEMRDKLEPLVVPEILQSGQRSKRKRKLVTVQLFDKEAGADGGSGGKNAKNKGKLAEKFADAPPTKNDKRFEKLKVVLAQLTERWSCETHSLPDKPTLCWSPKDQPGTCYPITTSNMNFWASCIISEPTRHSVAEKPLELNLMGTAPRRVAGSLQNNTRAQDAQPMPMSMPYPYYPPPHQMFYPMQQQQWGPQPFMPAQNPTIPPRSVKGPAISTWLQYCDSLPIRQGENFVELAGKFGEQGYRTIDQLTSGRMSIENLSGWLGIGKGTADYIIQYADEDMALVRSGKFTMNLDIPGDNEA